MSFPSREPDASQWKVCDMVVDLGVEHDAALARGLPFLKVFADVVRIPEDFTKTIGGYQRPPGSYLRHMQIVARRMEAGGRRAKLRINAPLDGDGPSTVSLLIGEIDGRLELEKVNYDDSGKPSAGERVDAPATGEQEDLCFVRYSSAARDGRLLKTPRPMELKLLQPGEPLHQLFTASYAQAATLAGQPSPPIDLKDWAHARDVLDWLARWTKYPGQGGSGQSEIAFFAEALTRVLPSVTAGGSTIYSIPVRPSKSYLGELKMQFELAGQMEARLAAVAANNDLKTTFEQFVTTLSDRDEADLGELDVLIAAASERVKSSNAAVEDAADKIKDLQLDAKLGEIKLQAEREAQAIMDTVTAVFNVVYGLYQIVSGVASGLAAARAVGAVKAVGDIPTLMQQFLGHAASSSDSSKDKAFQVVYTLGYLPYSEMYQAWTSTASKDRDALIGAIKNGVPTFMAGAGKISGRYLKDRPDEKDLNAIAGLVGDATRALDSATSKAAWDTFQIDIETKLAPEINANKGDVTKAARNLQAVLKKLVIAGKLLAEQQSTLALANREFGTLVLRKHTIRKSRALFDELVGKLVTDADRSELLIAAATARLTELKQSFFARTWEYKAAYFHETAGWPKPEAKVPDDATTLGLQYAKLEAEAQTPAPNGGAISVQGVKLLISDEDVLTGLRANGEAPFVIDFKESGLADYQLVRLKTLVPGIAGVKSKETGQAQGYTISLTSAADYWDHHNGENVHSQGRPSSVSFSYHADGTVKDSPQVPFGGATPSPFTEWTVKVDKAAELDLTSVQTLSLDLSANAWRRIA